MCLSPSLFPLPPLSPTVLEPYLKAKRKTGFNTPACALGAESPSGAPHRPDGDHSSAAPGAGSPQKGSARGGHACRCCAEPRAVPTHAGGRHAAFSDTPSPVAGPGSRRGAAVQHPRTPLRQAGGAGTDRSGRRLPLHWSSGNTISQGVYAGIIPHSHPHHDFFFFFFR